MMVTPVNGFQSSDGTIFTDERMAYLQEVKLALMIALGNEGVANTVLSNRSTIFPPLKALMEFEANMGSAESNA